MRAFLLFLFVLLHYNSLIIKLGAEMKVLVTGGAGYIGSHVVKQLSEQGYGVVVYDNLSTGKRDSVLAGKFVQGDLADKEKLNTLFEVEKFQAVMNFAGSIVVPESVKKPLEYYANNTKNTLNLLMTCRKYKVNKFIFSSTAAVYGMLESGICLEDSPLAPMNPYGTSKWMTEMMLKDLSIASKEFNYIAFRYFNVAGAERKGRLGQQTPKATHLIKVACEVATKKREKMTVFGTDYDTPDGTCVRDYIHVEDLAAAHIKGLQYLADGGKSNVFNVGYGKGYSVKEVLETFKNEIGIELNAEQGERREGDAPLLISNCQKIKDTLGWEPEFDDLGYILKTAYDWEKSLV